MVFIINKIKLFKMKKIFKNIKKAIEVELIKKKRSGIFSLSFIFGMFFPFLLFIVKAIRFVKNDDYETKIPENFYLDYLQDSLTPFTMFFFPILIVFCASKISQIDHKNKGWSLMETLPTTKFSIYFSKYLLLIFSNLLAIASLLISSLLFGWLLSLFFEIPSDKIVIMPFLDFFEIGIRLFMISLCLSAFHYGVSVLISSFIWPMIIGFIAILVPMILNKYKIFYYWYPYQSLIQISSFPKGSDFGYWVTYLEILSLLYTIVFLYIGYNWYNFKSFIKAFFNSKKKALSFIGVLIVILPLIYLVLTPKQQKTYSKTVICGQILSDEKIENVYVLNPFLDDTIAKIKVENNKFYHSFKRSLKPDFYRVNYEKYVYQKVFFGDNDSINLSCKFFKKQYVKVGVKGTRISENMENKYEYPYAIWESMLYGNAYIDNAKYYMENISKDWKKNRERIGKHTSVDNLSSRADFIKRKEKLTTLRYLTLWNKFVKKRKALFPFKKYVVSDDIKKLKNSLSLRDEVMLSNSSYFKYVLNELIQKDNRNISREKKAFSVIEKLEKGEFKNRMLFQQLNKSLFESNKIKVRDSLMKKYFNLITNKSYKKILQKYNYEYNRLTKGEKAPDFVAYNAEGTKFNLASFKGKYILIDCWATWCKPCKDQEPYFERKAFLYKNMPIQFIAINNNSNKEDWLIDIKDKQNQVLHLRPENIKLFGEKYSVNSLPRFILIDKEGRFVNSEFVRPQDKVFDKLLKSYLK
ncbi:hypothetical protein DS884_04730 [Tenacibaculum sp. E3R01]|nr:hypothetical protein DS884_04730 [Tenacibaculum sp. E3R01]